MYWSWNSRVSIREVLLTTAISGLLAEKSASLFAMVHLGDVNPSVWDEIVEVMEAKLKDINFQEEDITINWRIPADSKRLDRELYEKYGMFKDIILHPQFQYCKQIAEENVNFDFVLGDSMLPLATAVIALFMLHKRVSNNIIALAAAFIFNVNPLYVCLIVFSWWLTKGGNKKPKLYNPKKYRGGKVISTEPKEYSSDVTIASEYEHVLIGNDLSTLYTAALLSKNGHKVNNFIFAVRYFFSISQLPANYPSYHCVCICS